MPRRPEQFEEIREKSREKILTAALELFANKGYGSTSLDGIAKKAGISKGLIYNYFENKQTILFAILEGAMNRGDLMLDRHKDTKDHYVRLRNIMEDFFEMVQDSHEYLKLLLVLSLQPGVMEDAKVFYKAMFERTKKMITLFSGEEKKKDMIKGLMLDALIDGIMINYMRFGDEYPLQAIKERMIQDYCTPPAKKSKAKSEIKTIKRPINTNR